MYFQTTFACSRDVIRVNSLQGRIYVTKETPVFDEMNHALNFTDYLDYIFGDNKGSLKGLIQM